MIKIQIAHSEEHVEQARKLFRRYADTLDFDLEFQGFSWELSTLPGDYAGPGGCLLLAEEDGCPVGCVALRLLEDGICEMKRLFVLPEFRGRGAGRMLACEVIDRARDMGYHKMRLDTVASMKSARALYYSLQFRDIEAYRYNPVEGSSYMELDLIE
jgi:ribosomal protein S18 acetylase RimI-like enzyme